MTGPAPTPGQLDVAQASYERCRQSEAFLSDFYGAFLASDPAIPPLFSGTDFERQKRLLQHALGLLLSYARRPNPHLLERLAVRHGPTDLNIPDSQYASFVSALVETVKRHDAQCDSGVEEAWRAALTPGIRFMTGYGR